MKRYTFKLVINEGYDEFWEDITKRNISGCDEVGAMITQALWSVGIDVDNGDILTLIHFENTDADV